MQNPGTNLLGFTYIPEVLAQISTGSPSDIHLLVIGVSAVRALPVTIFIYDDLTVKLTLIVDYQIDVIFKQ